MVWLPEIPRIVVLLFWVLVLAIIAVLIDGILNHGDKFFEALTKRQTVSREEITSKIELMIKRTQVIEDKVDKINTILEKVSE